MKLPLPCFVCGSELDGEEPSRSTPPLDGVYFESSGNYGSTVWDPAHEDFCLELNVCDECLREREDRVVTVVEPPDTARERRVLAGIVDPEKLGKESS